MPGNRLPRRLLYRELSCGRRSVRGQKKRFNDHIKSSLSKCGILFHRLEELTGDRECRAVCDKGLPTFEQQHIDVAVAKHMTRHQQRNQPPPTTTRQGSTCAVCSRVCASAFGATCADTRKRVEQRHRRTDGQLRERGGCVVV